MVLERHALTDASVAPGGVSLAVDALSYICVLTLLYICSHINKKYCQVCVLILLHRCPHTRIYVSSYYYIGVLILGYMCPHTPVLVVSPQAVDALQRAVQLGKLNLIYLTKPHTFH